MSTGTPSRPRGYSLASLFLLTAVVCLLVGLAAEVIRGQRETDLAGYLEAAGRALGFGILGAILTPIIGFFEYRTWRGMGLASLIGGLAAAMSVILCYTPPTAWWRMWVVAVVGSAIVVAIASAIGWQQQSK